MSESANDTNKPKQQISPIVSTIVVFGILFIALNKGIDWYSHNKMITQEDERIEFILNNQNSHSEKCAVISNAISMANTLTDQKALDRFKKISSDQNCNSENGYVDGVLDSTEAAKFAEAEANRTN